MAPGLTRGNPTLQADARKFAQPLVQTAAPACKNAYLDNTSILASPAADIPHSPWSEIWTIDACGVPVNIQLDFTPDSTGTLIGARVVSGVSR
jgi:hypothetical protein